MQDDIIVKKPPASALTLADAPIQTEPAQSVAEPAPEPQQEAQVLEAALPKSSIPVGIIAAAVMICMILIIGAVYSTIYQA